MDSVTLFFFFLLFIAFAGIAVNFFIAFKYVRQNIKE